MNKKNKKIRNSKQFKKIDAFYKHLVEFLIEKDYTVFETVATIKLIELTLKNSSPEFEEIFNQLDCQIDNPVQRKENDYVG